MEDIEKISSEDINSFIIGAKPIESSISDEKEVYKNIKEDFIKTNEHFKYYLKTVIKEEDGSPAIEIINLYLKHPDHLFLL